MEIVPTRYLTDAEGKRVAVVLDLDEYSHILEALEELDDLRAFDEAVASNETPIDFEEAVAEIERPR